MKVVVACGGTGGHTYPGLAVAEELRRRGHEVVVWSSGRTVEASVLKRWDGVVFSTGARTLSARNAFAIIRSLFRCRAEMRRFAPDAFLAMGSYSSLPPVVAAWLRRVPVLLHEANTVPGRAVEFLSRFAAKVAISFEVTKRYLSDVETVRTGLPIRNDIAQGTRFAFIPAEAFVVFVTGGSQGAHAVNMLMKEALVKFHAALAKRGEGRPLYVIHQTGVADEADVTAAYAAAGVAARVQAFENEMANAFASADFVVARAGASTCFELAACGKPSLLIPLPSAVRNHQHFNADAFVSKGAADEGIQARLSALQISRLLMDRYDHPERLSAMRTKIRAEATPDAAARVADILEDIGQSTHKTSTKE